MKLKQLKVDKKLIKSDKVIKVDKKVDKLIKSW